MEDAMKEAQGPSVDADAYVASGESAGFDELFAEFTQRAHAAGLVVPDYGRETGSATSVVSQPAADPAATSAATPAVTPAPFTAPRPRLVVPPVGAPFGAPAASEASTAPPVAPVAPFDSHDPAYSALTARPAPVESAEEFEVQRFDPIAYASGVAAETAPTAFDARMFTPPVADVADDGVLRALGFVEESEPAATEAVLEEPVSQAQPFEDRDFDSAAYPPPAEVAPVFGLPAPGESAESAEFIPAEPIFKARPYVAPPAAVPTAVIPVMPAPATEPFEAIAPPVESAPPVAISFEAAGLDMATAVDEVEFEVATLSSIERDALDNADADLVAALQQVVLQRASDLHLTSDAPPMLRIDGGLRPATAGDEPWSREKVLAALLTLLSEAQQEKFDRELELDFAFTISANARFRVNFYQQRGAVGAAFRLIPTEIKKLGELGVPEHIGDFSQLPRGLVLVTGPTGSGKSTTLAALIDLANSTRADHIVTVEDPIEFLHRHKKSLVNQREVGHDTHSFASALKHVLRQDPDIILVGEMRDLETISVALTAAETGHLVFATLHTQDAAQTIDRVIDVFPPHQQDHVRAQLAATLQGVVCQTLVKRASGKGRAVATEVLKTTPAIANLIREGKTFQIASMMQAGRDLGMHTMDQHLAELVNSGAITQQAAREKAHDLDGFTRLLSGVESPTEASARAMQAGGIDFGDSFSTAKR
jgi:twitching motility protein PilT